MASVWIAVAIFALSLAMWRAFPSSRLRFRNSVVFLVLWAIALAVRDPASGDVALAFLELAGLQLLAGTVFSILSRRIAVPRFKFEMVVVAGYTLVIIRLLVNQGVNVTGIFATSAVATAVLGLALQDMLSNIAGGLALEFEREISVGDYIRCGDVAGWVQTVRLRHTTIKTADGDGIILPNSFLVRSPIVIQTRARRTLVPFSLPYSHNPHDVIEAVTRTLRASPLPGVAAEPAPSCVVRELAGGCIQYAAVYSLLESESERVALSAVLTRLWFALRRSGIEISEISTLLEVKPPEDVKGRKLNPVDILRTTPIFRLLDEGSLLELAEQLQAVSYAPGEFVLHQNEPGDCMYFVTSGEASISYAGEDNIKQEVAVIRPGDFFGEASLLTGAKRTANAIAKSRLDCYVLSKKGLEGLMHRLPELAEDIAVVIAHREMELDSVRQQLDRETARRREAESRSQLLTRIRRFFGIEDSSEATSGR